MQPLARDGYDAAAVRRQLLTDGTSIRFGVELVRPDLTVIEDISDDVESLTVSRNMTVDVHGAVRLRISRRLRWGVDRVRVYALLTAAGITTRWNLGVYVIDKPDEPSGVDLVTFDAAGKDVLSLLQRLVGDAYTIPAGTKIVDAVNAVIAASGVGAPVLIDADSAAATLPAARSWPLFPIRGASGDQPASWLKVANELLGMIAHEPLWADWDGRLRSRKLADVTAREIEWTFTMGDTAQGIVEPEYATSTDVWGAPNRWFFYSRGLYGPPVAGSTLYIKDNLDVGPSSQLYLGVVPAPPVALDAWDYASLVLHGDELALKQMRGTTVIKAKIGDFLALWHDDIAEWIDAGGVSRVRGRSWSMPDTGPFSMEWEVV